MVDSNLSFFKKSFLTILIALNTSLIGYDFSHSKKQKLFTIMLDPAGDAKHTGRVIDDNFERGLTLQFTEQLKKILEERNENIRVVLTRFPGETLEPLQNANFANRLDANFYINISFYQEKEERSQLYVYHYLSKPTDTWQKNLDPTKFYSYDKVHLQNISTSIELGQKVANTLKKKKYRTAFMFKGFTGIPFKQLAGIKSPAIAIEIGLLNKDNWNQFLAPIAEAIEGAIREK